MTGHLPEWFDGGLRLIPLAIRLDRIQPDPTYVDNTGHDVVPGETITEQKELEQ